MILAENRVANGLIYVSENDFEKGSSQVWFIAGQLRYYLSRIAVATIEIMVETDAKADGIHLSFDSSYNDDEFSITTENNCLYIKGGKRGVIYGGYELLEILGCRFFTPECEKIPTITKLEIPNINKRELPTFEYRHTDYASTTLKPKFATQCRLNGAYNRIPEHLGGHRTYALGGHSFKILVSHEKYRDTHPEYFSYCNGRRLNKEDDLWQLCLTNPDLVDIAAESVRKILKENPDKKIVSISQNDNLNRCQCEECLKSDEEEGSPVGTLIKFVNKIAEILEPEFPDAIFDILAYHYTRPSSRKTQTRHNVCVRLCASDTCFSHPYDKCEDRTHAVKRPNGKTTLFIEDLRDWTKVCSRLYVWDYTSNFPLYLLPFPNWRVLKPNLQILVNHNVKGIFEEANRAENGGADFNELRNYLLCKLMWNPDCDIDMHRKEFMDYFYGDAAPYLEEYLNLQCDIVEKENHHLYMQDMFRPNYLSQENIEKYYELFDKAEKAVAGDGIRLARVQKSRLSVRFADVYFNEIIDKNFDAEKINKFFTDLRAHNISRMDEWCNIEGTYYGWMKGWDRGIYVSEPARYQKESLL